MNDAGRQAKSLTGSPQTDSLLPGGSTASPGLSQADQVPTLWQTTPTDHSEKEAAPAREVINAWESSQLRSAYQKMKIGDYASAESTDPHNWTAHTLLAKALLSQPNPNYQAAKIEANRALNIHGNDSDMLDVLASALIHLVKDEIAVGDLRRHLTGAASENKRTAEAYFLLSQAYRQAGRHPEELKNLSEAGSYDPQQFSKLYEKARAAYDHQASGKEQEEPGYPRGGWWLGALLFLAAIVVFPKRMFRRNTLSSRTPRQAPKPVPLAAAAASKNETAVVAVSISWEPGAHLNHNITVIKLLGQGGMGEVYLAFDKSLGRNVAIKRMHPAIAQVRADRERFLREARSVSKLDDHPNIVRIHSILEMPNELGLVFEYIEGETLSQILARKRRLSFDEAREYLKPVCDALQHAHKHGIYHRDIKPSNIMIKTDGVVKVMDFGIAREAKSAMTTFTNTVMGTPPYMAPEMEMGVVSKEGDVYSLGVTLYELLSGETLFCGASTSDDKKNMNFRPLSSFVPGLPLGTDEFVGHALQPDSVRRIRSADNFSAGLDKLSVAPKAPAVEGIRRISRVNEITPSHGTA